MSNGICDTCRKFGKCDDTKNGRTTYCAWCHGYKPKTSSSTLDDIVLKKFKQEYEKAIQLEYVRNPVAYALYQTWKHFDEHKLTEKGQNNENIHKAESD